MSLCSSMMSKPFKSSLTALGLCGALWACESPQPTSGPLLVIDPSALVIGLPSEGSDYQEASLRLSNGGGADVLITNLQLIEEDDTPELTLLDADDWRGRVTLQPGESRELRVGWRLLDAQADRGELRLRSNDGLDGTLLLSPCKNKSSLSCRLAKVSSASLDQRE